MDHDIDRRLRDAEGDLKGHLKECALQNSMIWHELRALKRIQWVAVGGIIGVLLGIVGILLKFHLHL